MSPSRPQLFGMLAGLFLAAGLVLSSLPATTTWLKVKTRLLEQGVMSAVYVFAEVALWNRAL
ncbi:MAG: hypothetical protein KGJ60_05090 [Verrucomicrobiota bacterium]|nr:hypothetical protein [Verrucomicrobiota bacterium]